MHNGDELMTTQQVARALGISVQWTNKLAKSGRLPTAFKVPGGTGAWLFSRSDIEAEQRRRSAA